MNKKQLLENSFVPDVGDWFTVSEWLSHHDNSWKGECLKATFREGDYLIADIYCRGGGYDGMPTHRKVRYTHTLDLRALVLKQISDEFVERSLGPESAKVEAVQAT